MGKGTSERSGAAKKIFLLWYHNVRVKPSMKDIFYLFSTVAILTTVNTYLTTKKSLENKCELTQIGNYMINANDR